MKKTARGHFGRAARERTPPAGNCGAILLFISGLDGVQERWFDELQEFTRSSRASAGQTNAEIGEGLPD